MIDFSDKVALVTGASRGIGRATAELLGQLGARVAVHYGSREEAALEAVEAVERAGGVAAAFRADVARAGEVEAMTRAVLERWERVDVLVCNAGIWKGAPVDEMSEAQWDETLDVNLKGVYLCCRHVTPGMIRRSAGSIVTISSTAGQRGEAGHAHYAASKGGIISWTKSLAAELAPDGIRVNCVAPGWVQTDMAGAALESQGQAITATIPLRRAGRPEEIARAVAFLASDAASYVTGEIFNVNGGSVLCG